MSLQARAAPAETEAMNERLTPSSVSKDGATAKPIPGDDAITSARRAALESRKVTTMHACVRDVMITDVVAVRPDTSYRQLAELTAGDLVRRLAIATTKPGLWRASSPSTTSSPTQTGPRPVAWVTRSEPLPHRPCAVTIDEASYVGPPPPGTAGADKEDQR
jgi:hypothetical protein